MDYLRRIPAEVVLTSVLLLFAPTAAAAQDVEKVSPETHRLILENEHARVFDVHVKPGQKVATHSHPHGVLYYITDGQLKITYPDGRTEIRMVKAGTAAWSEAVTHAVENVGASDLHEVHTELKAQNK
jgi:quercetin dioxygenase-like cupin family protein